MPDTGPNNPGTLADDGSNAGAVAWSNSGNASASDNSYATAPLAGNDTHYLKATNFGFAIPAGTINGIKVEIERSADLNPAITDLDVRLVKGGAVSGSNKANVADWPVSDAYQTYGSNSDLWGLTLTPADLNASGFGVVISAQSSTTAVASIDHIRITVTHTPLVFVSGQSSQPYPDEPRVVSY